MHWHQVWIWTWFYCGMGTYWFKRAYYGINPPNPVATSYRNWIERSWAPLMIRAFLETLIYWIFFTPGMADKALAYFGWTTYSWAVTLGTEFAPFAAIVGHAMDSVVDMAVTKIPGIKDVLPQMPGPLPAPVVVQAQIVEQTTKVTQLQTQETKQP